MHRPVERLLFLLLLASTACAAQPGTRIRVATASSAEFTAAATEDEVWYQFKAGDIVPFQFMFFGALEGGGEQMSPIRAKRDFYLVVRKNRPLEISFDGKSFANSSSSQYMVSVLPREDSNGGRVGWLLYVGESGKPELELKELLEQADVPKSE